MQQREERAMGDQELYLLQADGMRWNEKRNKQAILHELPILTFSDSLWNWFPALEQYLDQCENQRRCSEEAAIL